MPTTIDLAFVQNLITGHKPELVAALRAQGVSEDAIDRLVVRNSATGEVLTNAGPGGKLEPAPACLQSKVGNAVRYTADDIDLVPPMAVLRNPAHKAHHDMKVRVMWLALLERNRPDLRRHPRVDATANYVVEYATSQRAMLAMLPDARARWVVLMNSTIEFLEELPHARRGATA